MARLAKSYQFRQPADTDNISIHVSAHLMNIFSIYPLFSRLWFLPTTERNTRMFSCWIFDSSSPASLHLFSLTGGVHWLYHLLQKTGLINALRPNYSVNLLHDNMRNFKNDSESSHPMQPIKSFCKSVILYYCTTSKMIH